MKEDGAESKVGGRFGKRLRAVRKRKRTRRGFACEVVVRKMRLVKIEEDRDR